MADFTFTDNFSPPSALWSNLIGNWTASNGHYYAQNPSNSPDTYSVLPFDFLNSQLQLTVTVNGLSDGGIWLDSDGSANNGVIFVLGGNGYGLGARGDGAGNSAYWSIWHNGTETDTLNEVDGVFTPGDTYTITVLINGNTYQAFKDPDGVYDANSVLLTTLVDNTFSSGRVGFYDFDSSLSFSNFSVSGTLKQPLSGQVVLSSIPEGTNFTGAVATFTDTDTSNTAADFTAAIDWGDGTTETGTVTCSNGSFAVAVPGSTHFYADEGSDQALVTVTRITDNVQLALSGDVTITEGDNLTPHSTTITAQPNVALTNVTVASFTDTNINNVVSDFKATINWGDGQATTGTVTGSGGSYSVSGNHTYTAVGIDVVTATLADDAPGSATATAISTANVETQMPTYSFSTLDDPLASQDPRDRSGFIGTYATGINASGQIVGWYESGNPHGFLFSGGNYLTLDYPSANPPYTFANGINDLGQIVGSNGGLLGERGFIYSSGNFTTLYYPNSTWTQAGGINDLGQIVGSYRDSSAHGFLYSNGSFTALDEPFSFVTGINDAGQIVGTYQDASDRAHGFLYSGGTYSTIDDPLAATTAPNFTLATGINDVGQIVGTYFDSANIPHSFLYSNGIFTTVDPPGSHGSFANGINDAGQIVGSYFDGNTNHGFLATPQPLSGQVVLSAATEGVALPDTTNVATFTDTNTSDSASAFTTTIEWGDGKTTTAGTVSGGSGSFTVSGGHTYADEGSDQALVTITRTSDGDQIAPTGTVSVAENDVLTGHPTTISANPGQNFSGTVASFTDTNTNNFASDFTATIDWGDGTPLETGTISQPVAGTFDVSGSHTYAAAATDNVTVTLADDAPSTATATAFSTAEVIPCYCGGTLILTDQGEVAVETLAIGDKVMTADGVARPIRWIGRRSYSGRFARGGHVLPICIKAGALDENVPHSDLWISPHHAMFLQGVLIEAQDLVNGVSVVQAASVERVDYFHIELGTHDIIVAEGALSESFIDDDSRGMFQNAHEFQALYPDEAARAARYYAPRLAFGDQVEAARRRIAQRAGIPYARPSTASRPRALVIDGRLPEIGHDGGANAILDHMRALQAAGFQVSFLAPQRGGDTRALLSLGVTPLPFPYSGMFSDVARKHAGKFDLVYLHRVESAMHCLKLARRYFDAQIVYSVADLHHVRLKAQSELDHDHAPELMQQAYCVALHELVATLSADCVITHSQAEADQLNQIPRITAEDKIRVIPWSVPVTPVRRSFAKRSGLAFIGGFGHAPNVDAARWLVHDVMPLVWREVPEITCLLIGSDMSEELRRQLERPGVDVLGHVDRLADVFERIRLTVAPLRFGAGLKDKVLRSMGAGLPCVGTTEGFKGMQELPSAITSDCRRDTAVDLAAAIVRMHRDETANTSCAQTGMRYVGAFYNQSRIDGLLQEMAQPALDRYRARSRSRSECMVLNFGDTHRQPSATDAKRTELPAKRVAFR